MFAPMLGGQSLQVPCLRRVDLPPRTPFIHGQIEKPFYLSIASASTYGEMLESVSDSKISSSLHQELMKSSLAYWASHMISGPLEEPYGGHYLLAKHHLGWDRAYFKSKRICIKAARDHGKSNWWSRAFPIWYGSEIKPGCLIYIFSSSQLTVEERFDELKAEIRDNHKLQYLIPETGERLWSKREIKLSTGTIIRARGWGVRVRGGHPHVIICDDVIDDDSLYSDTKRRRAVDYFFSVPSNMIVPGGTIVVCGTPFHYSDLYSKIAETKKYYCLNYPAEDKQGRPLFPARYSKEALIAKREEIGETRYSREFQCVPLADASSLFPSYLFEQQHMRQPYILGLGWEYWEKLGWPRYTGVDLAFSAETKSDYTAIFTIAIDTRGNRWIVNIRHGLGWSYDKQIMEIEEEWALTRADSVCIEANQAQRVYGQNLLRETIVPVKLFFTAGTEPKKPWRRGMTRITGGKNSLDRGIPAIRLGLERNKWRIPRGDHNSIEKTDRWIGELNAIAFENGKIVSVGEHDDLVLSCWMADYDATRSSGIMMSFGGEPELEKKTESLVILGEGVTSDEKAGILAVSNSASPVMLGDEVEFTKPTEELAEFSLDFFGIEEETSHKDMVREDKQAMKRFQETLTGEILTGGKHGIS